MIALLRLPGVARLVVPAVLARVPVSMVYVGLLLLVQRETGSFAIGGAVEASLSIAAAVIAPLVARIVDRTGQTRALLTACVIDAAALVALVVATLRGAPVGLLCALAAVAGAAMPPVSPSIRSLWPRLVEGSSVPLATAFAFESVCVELFFILGPLLAGTLIALASPAAAILTAAGLVLVGTLGFAAAPESRAWRSDGGERHWAGPLRAPGFRALVAAVLPQGVAFGVLGVALAGFAVAHHDRAATGVLWALQAVGSAVGGVAYARRGWGWTLERRYAWLSAAFALGLAPLALAGSLPVLGALLLFGSVALAPVTATAYELVDRLAPAGTTAEGFTWLIVANVSGASLGSALGGLVVQHGHAGRAFVLSAACAAIASGLAWALRPRLAGAVR